MMEIPAPGTIFIFIKTSSEVFFFAKKKSLLSLWRAFDTPV